ncbi:hypothetical protein [Intrasporangium sp.]|uniref:hypothetical protein n=1 Tax=Intrasporangium sp. TaxID=1925024 RepID=UPI003221735E
MSTKTTLATAAAIIALAVSVTQALEPHTASEIDQQRRDQQVQDLSDSQDRVNDTLRNKANADADANRIDKLNPGEHRPPEAHLPDPVKLKLRWR